MGSRLALSRSVRRASRVAIAYSQLPMKKPFIPTLVLFICFGQLLVVSVQLGVPESFSTDRKTAVEAERRAVEPYNSGLKGTTSSIVVSGVPGGQRTGGPASIEFAIAPIQEDKPAYHKAIFVKSDRQGQYEVALPPGTYWIGPKAKALNPANYRPGAVVLPEKEAVVREGVFTQLDLVEVGYAP